MIITPANTLISQYGFATTNPTECKHPAIVGGFGSGKTRAIPLRWLSLIDWRGTHQRARTKLMVVEPTKEMIRDILVEAFDEFFDEHGITHSYHKTNHDYTITYRGHKFTALFRSSDDPNALTGKNLTDIILDEFDKKHSITHQKEVWKECISRTRKVAHGTVGIVTTPEGYKETYNLYSECEHGQKKNFKLIRAKTYDNFFLPKDFVSNLYDQYSAELVRQYIEAEFINLTQGKIYYSYNREANKTDRVYDNALPLKLCVDFNVSPMMWCLVQTYQGRDHVIDQIVKHNTNTEEMAKEVLSRYGHIRYYVYGDYSGKARSTKTSTTDYDIIKEILPGSEIYIKPNPLVIDRINAVNSRLCNSRGEKRLLVNTTKCPDVVKDFEQVLWSEDKKEIDKKSNKDLTHISDALGYYIEYEYSLKGKPTVQHNYK